MISRSQAVISEAVANVQVAQGQNQGAEELNRFYMVSKMSMGTRLDTHTCGMYPGDAHPTALFFFLLRWIPARYWRDEATSVTLVEDDSSEHGKLCRRW